LTYYELANQSSLLRGYEKAILDFKEAIKLEPNFVEACFGLGWAKERLKRYEEAISIFRQAAGVRPDLDVLQVAISTSLPSIRYVKRKSEPLQKSIEKT
jgi:tetratricopeptide (TPR) repeat protein